MLTGGVLQIGLTIGVVAIIASALGLATPEAIFFGMLLAHTSTTVMLTVFQHRGGGYTAGAPRSRHIGPPGPEHLPMILLVPMLGGMGSAGLVPRSSTSGSASSSRHRHGERPLDRPRLLYRIASLRSRDSS